MIEMAAPVDLAGIAESAFLHYTTRCRVIHKEITPKNLKPLDVKAIVYHDAECLCAQPLVPVGLGNPIAQLGIVPASLSHHWRRISLSVSFIDIFHSKFYF